MLQQRPCHALEPCVEAGLLAVLLVSPFTLLTKEFINVFGNITFAITRTHQQVTFWCISSTQHWDSLAPTNLTNLLLQTVFSGDTYTRGFLQMPTMTGTMPMYAHALHQYAVCGLRSDSLPQAILDYACKGMIAMQELTSGHPVSVTR